MGKLTEKQLAVARQEFQPYLSLGKKALSKLKLETPLSFFSEKLNTTYESLGCVGYNSTYKQLTATVNIKRSTGYSGNLCSKGSYEYVRFYMDYGDGNGWEDMGVVGVNVHDIPTKKDCEGKDEKPISFVVRLDINPKKKLCTLPNLPKVRAVLSWNVIPEENDPELTLGTYVWSDKKDAQIQISPIKFFIPNFPILEIDDLLETAIINPNLSFNQLASINPDIEDALIKAKHAIVPKGLSLNELTKVYKKDKIEPHRFGYKLLKQAISTPYVNEINDISNQFEFNNFNLSEILANLNKTECNKDYEELICVGADYNREALVGTLKIKKPSGYSGSLCNAGSKEYVSFWVQTEENCEWKHAGTSFVNVHDIQNIPADGLFYSVVLPYKFNALKANCSNPQVLKVRAILSWNSEPTGMNCSNWGNVVESYVQLRPKEVWNGAGPRLVAVGGVRVENINNISGLTIPDSSFKYTGLPVRDLSNFAGLIVIEAKTNEFLGQKYKIKIENLIEGTSYYLNTPFALDDTTTFSFANSNDEYTYYGDANNNTNNIVARFKPGTDNKFRITLEHLDGSSYSQVIQMDNTSPVLDLNIDNYGDCSHFVKGSIITGNYSVEEANLYQFNLTTNLTDSASLSLASGGVSTAGSFSFVTSSNKNCGEIVLGATPRTIVNSSKVHSGVPLRRIVCLKDIN